MSNFLFSGLWVFIDILSPFLLFMGYPLLKRFPRFFEPEIVLGGVFSVSLLFAFEYVSIWTPNNGLIYGYTHFLGGGVLFMLGYLALVYEFKYPKVDSAVLAWLCIIAIDQLWQLPYDVINWTTSLQSAEIGLATGAWSLMSIPILLYFVRKFNNGIRIGHQGKVLLVIILGFMFTGSIISLSNAYLLIFPWFLFFIRMFSYSKNYEGKIPEIQIQSSQYD